jgi:hypothetical protein
VKPSRFLWSAEAQRLKLSKTFSGEFTVTVDSYRFSCDGRSLAISNDAVTHIFIFDDHSIQLFTSDFRNFIFSFPTFDIHDILAGINHPDLRNLVFFQTRDAKSESDSMNLITRWESSTLSSLELLVWANLLSGRSPLSLHSPLLFPPTSSSDIFSDPSIQRDDHLLSEFLSVHFPSFSPLHERSRPPRADHAAFPALPARPLAFDLTSPTRLLAATDQGRLVECVPSHSPRDLAPLPGAALAAFHSRGLSFVGRSGSSLCEVDLAKFAAVDGPISPHFCEITAIATGGGAVVTGGHDGSIVAWRPRGRFDVLFAHSAPVACLAVAHGVVASGGRDGAVVLAILPGMLWLRRIAASARRIALAGGRVVVACGGGRNTLRTVPVNEGGVVEVDIEAAAVELCAIAPGGGGQFVAVVARDGRVAVYEANALRRVEVVGLPEKVVAVKWKPELNAIVAVTEGRTVVIVPWEME